VFFVAVFFTFVEVVEFGRSTLDFESRQDHSTRSHRSLPLGLLVSCRRRMRK